MLLLYFCPAKAFRQLCIDADSAKTFAGNDGYKNNNMTRHALRGNQIYRLRPYRIRDLSTCLFPHRNKPVYETLYSIVLCHDSRTLAKKSGL